MLEPPDPARAREHHARNVSQLLLLASGLGLLLSAVLWSFWGWPGALVSFAVAGGLVLMSSRVPGEAVVRLFDARLMPRDESQLASLTDVLAYRAGLAERPGLYVIPSMTMNAFTAGTAKPVIALTEGLLRRLSLRETAGVIAHEMSHIRNRDLDVLGFADFAARTAQVLAYAGLVMALFNLWGSAQGYAPFSWWTIGLLYLAPFLFGQLQLSLSRVREFEADRGAVETTGDPQGLASALRRVDDGTGAFWEDLMLPVPARRMAHPCLLRSHPPTVDRIHRLMATDQAAASEPLVIIEQPMVVGMGAISLRPRYHWTGVWY